jgi:HTH-type transcriptional regulator/antitoxin MqsA
MKMTDGKNYCLQCDDGTLLEYGVKDMDSVVRSFAVHVPAVSGAHCPKCGECEFDPGEGKRFSDEVDRQLAEAEGKAIRSARKKLGLRQTDAGNLFGGGVSAFSEYERGKTRPHKSTVLLLRLLDKHRELLQEIRQAV